MPLEREHVKAIILQELPAILEQDADVRQLILRLAQQHFANRGETESRFDRVLEELRRDREEQNRKWDENQRALKAMQDEANRKWEEQNRRWEEQNRKWDENQRALKAAQDEARRTWDENQRALKAMQDEANRKWEEQNRKWDENQRALKAAQDEARRTWDENQRALKAAQDEARRTWDENQRALKAAQDEANRKWEEQNRKWDENQRALKAAQDEARRTWDENQRALKAMQDEANRKWEEDHREIMAMIRRMEALDRKYDSTIGALGARWGLYSEQSFRNALRGILTGFFNIEVINVIEYDDTGAVFGRPDQIELDLIIKNGLLIICEIKSSVSKADVYAFERKARWYEQRHARQADRLMIISPMVDARAREAARRLQIDMYSFAEEAGEALSGEAERSDRATNADC
jgi:hypothetical protein